MVSVSERVLSDVHMDYLEEATKTQKVKREVLNLEKTKLALEIKILEAQVL